MVPSRDAMAPHGCRQDRQAQVHPETRYPATAFGMRDRDLVRPGMVADVQRKALKMMVATAPGPPSDISEGTWKESLNQSTQQCAPRLSGNNEQIHRQSGDISGGSLRRIKSISRVSKSSQPSVW
jgi:hypothetical protein